MGGGFLEMPLRPDWLLRALVVAALIFGCVCALLLTILEPLLGGLILLALGLAAVVVCLTLRWRSTRQETRLWVLALAATRGMPLSAALEALSGQEGGGDRERLLSLARLLNQGAPLSEALGQVPGVLPSEAEPLLRLGWDPGQLAKVLREVAESHASRRPLRAAFMSRLVYLGSVLVIMQVIVAFVMYFIIPKYEAIFMDFGVPLPRVTTTVIKLAHLAATWGAPLLALVVLADFGFFLLAARGGRTWDLPLLDRLLLRKHTATILRGLAWVVEGARPLPAGVAALARDYPSRRVREKLERVLHDLDLGADCWEALGRRGLIRGVDKGLLEAAGRVGNLPWALREVAESGERRLDGRLRAGLDVLSTLVVIGLGGVVLLIATAYFAPLITLIGSLAG